MARKRHFASGARGFSGFCLSDGHRGNTGMTRVKEFIPVLSSPAETPETGVP